MDIVTSLFNTYLIVEKIMIEPQEIICTFSNNAIFRHFINAYATDTSGFLIAYSPKFTLLISLTN